MDGYNYGNERHSLFFIMEKEMKYLNLLVKEFQNTKNTYLSIIYVKNDSQYMEHSKTVYT